MLTRRSLVTAGAAYALAAPSLARAQARFPTKPITLIVSYAAGGGTDAVARIFAARLERVLDGRVLVENRPGAAANLGTEAVAAAAPPSRSRRESRICSIIMMRFPQSDDAADADTRMPVDARPAGRCCLRG